MTKPLIWKFDGVRADKTRKVRTPLPGSQSAFVQEVPDGVIVGDLEVQIDVAQIAAEFGLRALLSKSKRSRALRGKIKVIARNIREVGP